MQARDEIYESKPAISIIIPAYNAEDTIMHTLANVKRVMSDIALDYEVIVVNDGSSDGTSRVLAGINDGCVKVLNHILNLGKGAAIKTGVKHAKGKYIIMLDADKDIDANNMKMYIDMLSRYDIVIGSKRHPASIYEAPFLRKVLSIAFNMLVRVLLGINISDTQTGFKAFKADHLKTIMSRVVSNRYSFDVEMLALANLLGLRIAEVPVHIRQEKLFKIKDIVRMFLELIGIVYRLRIAKWYQKTLSLER
jgi:glycosyltransferase involved in cell wall biosynthesis